MDLIILRQIFDILGARISYQTISRK